MQLIAVEQYQITHPHIGVSIRQTQDDAVVGRMHLSIEAVTLLQTCGDGHGPRLVNASAERGVHDDAPIAVFLPTTFHDEFTVVGHDASRFALFGQQCGQIADGVAVKSVVPQSPLRRCGEFRFSDGAVRSGGQFTAQLADETSFRHAEMVITSILVAMPERQTSRAPGSRQHHDTVVGDLLDLPCRSAQGDDVPDPGFVDHLLIQLPHFARPRAGAFFGEHDGIHATVGNGAAAGDCETRGTGSGGDKPRFLVVLQRRPECGEVLAVVGAGHHAHGGVEHGTFKIAERRGSAYHGIPFVRFEVVHRRRRDRLLREHIQWIADDAQWFEIP